MSDSNSAPASDVLAEQAASAPQTAATQTAPAADPQLTLADLQGMMVVINTASKRGAFQAAEMSQVGGLYERIEAYVKHMSP